jgi:RNA polymerase sigma factor (sigma-70 family)
MAIPLESIHDAKLMPKPLQTDDPEQAILAEISKGEIQRMISELNPHYADVIRLKEIEGLSYQQIANELGLTTKSVEGRLSRARAKLKTRQVAFHRCFSEETLCAVPRRA